MALFSLTHLKKCQKIAAAFAGKQFRRKNHYRRRSTAVLQLSNLESRELLVVTPFSPAQIQNIYGYNNIVLNKNGPTSADGTGQTIAIVDGGDDTAIASDLGVFDQQFAVQSPPTFTKSLSRWHQPSLDGGDGHNLGSHRNRFGCAVGSHLWHQMPTSYLLNV